VGKQSAVDVFRLLRYWAEEPPAHVILALRYLGERKSNKPKTEAEAMGQLQGAASLMGQAAAPMPQHLREMAGWAEEMQVRLRKGEISARK
jgi:hypothetical protein